MAEETSSSLDVRIATESALAPVLDITRETNALLRAVLEDLQALRAEVAALQRAVADSSD